MHTRKEQVIDSSKETPVEPDELLLDADADADDTAEVADDVVEVAEDEEIAVDVEEEAAPEAEKKAPRTPSHMAMGKAPPPPKDWRIQGTSPEGLTVTLGRYNSKAEADPDFSRLSADGFYTQIRIVTPNGKVEAGEAPKEAKKR